MGLAMKVRMLERVLHLLVCLPLPNVREVVVLLQVSPCSAGLRGKIAPLPCTRLPRSGMHTICVPAVQCICASRQRLRRQTGLRLSGLSCWLGMTSTLVLGSWLLCRLIWCFQILRARRCGG